MRANPTGKFSNYNIRLCGVCSKRLHRGSTSGRCYKHRIISEFNKKKQADAVRLAISGANNPMKRLEVRMKFSGSKCHFWKGGISPINKRIRRSLEYLEWRESVFKRDNWTCQNCNARDGRELHPHHIKSFSKYPELRFELSNGLTLCIGCHKLTDNYAYKAKI